MVVIRSVPVISLVLIALLWFSPNQLPVFIALLTMWPVLYQNMLNGLESTDERLVEMARVFGKTKMQRLEHIYLPSAKNLIFSGISTAMGFGWRAVIIGEVLSQPFRGIGTGMKTAQAYINISDLIAWTVVAILISYLFEHIIKYIGRIKLAYRPVTNPKKQTLNSFKTESNTFLLATSTAEINSSGIFVKLYSSFSTGFISYLKYLPQFPLLGSVRLLFVWLILEALF